MKSKEYKDLVDELTKHRRGISAGKRRDYTRDDEDVLKNFKNQADTLGITPETSLAVHMEKQFSAVLTYIKTDGQSESEPIKNRISDCLNYLELLWGLINEDEQEIMDSIVNEIDTTYKLGDVVEIVDNVANHPHNFSNGDVVTLEKKYPTGRWRARNSNGEWWMVHEDDMKPATSTNRSTGI